MGKMKNMNLLLVMTTLPMTAKADLFKCMACTNKPANAHYTSGGINISNCSWSCDSEYKNINNKCMRDLSTLKESDFEKLFSVDIGTCSNGVLDEGIYMVKLRGGKGGAGYGNTSIEQEDAVGSVFYISDSDGYNLCAAKDGVDSNSSKNGATGGTSSYFTLKSGLKYAETKGSRGSEAKKCSTGCSSRFGISCNPHSLSTIYRVCKNYISSDNICTFGLIGTPGVNSCEIRNIEYAASGGCASSFFGGCSVISLESASDSVRQLFSGGDSASIIKDTISVQNCSGSCAILYKLK